MEHVAPCGNVYQAGTLSGNPVAMAAGLAQLRYLQAHPQVYEEIGRKGAVLAEKMRTAADRAGIPVAINQIGSLLSPFFVPTGVSSYIDAKGSDLARYARYFGGMLERGIALAPAQFEAMFVSASHTDELIAQTVQAVEETFAHL